MKCCYFTNQRRKKFSTELPDTISGFCFPRNYLFCLDIAKIIQTWLFNNDCIKLLRRLLFWSLVFFISCIYMSYRLFGTKISHSYKNYKLCYSQQILYIELWENSLLRPTVITLLFSSWCRMKDNFLFLTISIKSSFIDVVYADACSCLNVNFTKRNDWIFTNSTSIICVWKFEISEKVWQAIISNFGQFMTTISNNELTLSTPSIASCLSCWKLKFLNSNITSFIEKSFP